MRFALILITLFVCLSPVLSQKRKPLTLVSNTFVVNDTGDANDASAGNGLCATSTGVCTLRAAIQEANAVAGADTITFSVQGVINLQNASSEDGESALTISRDVIINGPGANLLTVRPNAGFQVRVLNVLPGVSASISGLTISDGRLRDRGDCHSEPELGLSGGGIYNAGTLQLNRVVISNNRAGNGGECGSRDGGEGGSGGGVFNTVAATLTMIDSTVNNNEAGIGGINHSSNGNVPGVGGPGGGIRNAGTMTILNSTVHNNKAGRGGEFLQGPGIRGGVGGGIFNQATGVLIVTNSTLSGNRAGDGSRCVFASDRPAGDGGDGGGIYNAGGGQLTLSNSTVAFNMAGVSPSGCNGGSEGDGGGITSGSSATIVRSSMIAGNTAGDADDVNGPMRSRGYNLIQSLDGQAVITEEENAGTNITLVNPQLQSLADNGGPTLTHAIRANSPAVDKGRNFAADPGGNSLNTDQRGEHRPTDLVTFMNAMNGDGSDIGAYELVVLPVTPGQLIISEFRTNGPGGASDDYVEIYNTTNSDIDVLAVNNSAGFLVHTTANRNCLIPNGTVIKAHGNFLCAGSGYSLPAVATPDATFSGEVLDNAGIALFPMSQQILANAALDRVAPSGSTFGSEGTVLSSFSSAPTAQHAWLRDLASGAPRDSDNNAADFRLVSPGGGVVGGLQSILGAPGPEGSTSPVDATSRFGILYLDETVAATAAPNRVRDLNPNAANNSTFGTLSIRRRFVNNTGGPVTRLRFRIINITGFPVTDASWADVRAINSVDAVINGTLVRGLTLETPPAQAFGGGLNSTLSINTPLANGESIAVEFRLGVQKTGNFRFYVNVEALP